MNFEVAQMLCGVHFPDQQIAFDGLTKKLWLWTERLGLPRLSRYGVSADDRERLVTHVSPSSMKTNPIELTADEIAAIVRARI